MPAPSPILVRLAETLDVAAAHAAIGRDGAVAALFEIARIDTAAAARAAEIGVWLSEADDDPFGDPEAFEALMALAGVLAAEVPREAAAIGGGASPGGRLAGLLRMPLPGFVDPALAWTLHALRLEAAEAEAVAAREAVESAFDPRPAALEALAAALADAGASAAEARARALALRAAAAAGRPCDIPEMEDAARLAAVELAAMETALAAAAERQAAALKALPPLDLDGIRRLHARAIAESEAWLARGCDAAVLLKVLLDSFPSPDLDAAVALSPRLRLLVEAAPALAAGQGRVVVLAARRRAA
jgi:hypothetical protein